MDKKLIVLVGDEPEFLHEMSARLQSDHPDTEVQRFVGRDTDESQLSTHCFGYEPDLVITAARWGQFDTDDHTFESLNFIFEVACLFPTIVIVSSETEKEEISEAIEDTETIVAYRDDPDLMTTVARLLGIDSHWSDDSSVN